MCQSGGWRRRLVPYEDWYRRGCVTVKGTSLYCEWVQPPSLFNVYMDDMMRKVSEGEAGGVKVGGKAVHEIYFAEDITLLANTPTVPFLFVSGCNYLKLKMLVTLCQHVYI